mmetsp:Transcript_40045/g.99250  ORF Transcript_40045/g.99250 Transcript_40045/m.99250 type:complete len:276 (+) Transcript_40045:407-1234(+)
MKVERVGVALGKSLEPRPHAHDAWALRLHQLEDGRASDVGAGQRNAWVRSLKGADDLVHLGYGRRQRRVRRAVVRPLHPNHSVRLGVAGVPVRLRAIVAQRVEHHRSPHNRAQRVGEAHLLLAEHEGEHHRSRPRDQHVPHVARLPPLAGRQPMRRVLLAVVSSRRAVDRHVGRDAERDEVGAEGGEVLRHARVAELVDVEAVLAHRQAGHIHPDCHVGEWVALVLLEDDPAGDGVRGCGAAYARDCLVHRRGAVRQQQDEWQERRGHAASWGAV